MRPKQRQRSIKSRTAIHAFNYTTDELQEALRPLASLISKSEKAQQKLAPGTWQHTMLQGNLKALQIASALMNKETNNTDQFTRDDLQDAIRVFAAMMSRIDKARAKFTLGTSQYSLQRNRLKAVRIAEALTKVELDKRNAYRLSQFWGGGERELRAE